MTAKVKLQEREIIFESIQERDKWIEENFPKRRCMNCPGAYKVPGGYLQVFMERVRTIAR